MITDTHQLDILGAIAVLRENGGRLPERQTDLDVILREPEPQRFIFVTAYRRTNRSASSLAAPSSISSSSRSNMGRKSLRALAFEIGSVSSSSSSSSGLKNKLPINSSTIATLGISNVMNSLVLSK
jgi:hypothetical protein